MTPKILMIDIETAPALGMFWSLFDRYIDPEWISQPGFTLCWSAKWLGKSKMHFSSVRKHGMEKMLEKVWLLLDEADAVVHYNGTKFDIPTLNREFVMNDFAVPSTFKEVDLINTVKKRFRFMSNKLDFVAKQLGVETKLQHKGKEMWKGCMAGRKADWLMMEEYNKQDVVVLEAVYRKLLPWIQGHPNFALFVDDETRRCPHCGGTHLQRRGYYYTETMRYPKYQCMDLKNCGKWSRGRLTDLPIEKRRGLLVGVK